MDERTVPASDNEDFNSYVLIVPRPPQLKQRGDQRSSPPPRQKKITDPDLLAEELQHASDMSVSEFAEPEDQVKVADTKTSRRSSDSSIRVEIQDWGSDGSFNFTTSTLHKCKRQVLRPYWGLLTFIGWRGLNKESVYFHRHRWRILNVVYPSVITLLLFYTYMYEILACEWKLNLDSEVALTTQPTPTTTQNHTSTPIHWSNLGTVMMPKFNITAAVSNTGCDHIITTYLVPNLLHFLAYVMGLYYFRIQENEQLYALMEKVFLQAAAVHAMIASQQKMIYRLRLFLVFGSLWVVTTVLLQCLYVWAFNFPKMPLFESMGEPSYWILFSLELLGRTVFNSVILAIMMNYGTQCEMIKFYVRGLGMRLQEKSTDLKAAMKDVLMLRQSLSLLNGIISNMTSLASVILGELAVIDQMFEVAHEQTSIARVHFGADSNATDLAKVLPVKLKGVKGLCILFLNKHNDPKVWVYRSFFPVIWAIMLIFPLFQAARVNSVCLQVQKIALEMRVFGYKGASILDLDSFLQFVTVTKLKAKLFHIPILPSYLIFSAVVTTFILLILVQTSNIGPPGHIL